MIVARCVVGLFVFAAVLGACGGDKPPPKTPAHHQEGHDEATGPSLDVSSEVGALDEGKVTSTFMASIKDLQACLQTGAQRVEFLGGSVAFFVKVDSHGGVAHAHLEQSTIGDRETEKCMLDSLRRREWPAPVGGQTGLARKSFDFDPPNDVRPPTDWSPSQVSSAIAAKSSAIDKCKSASQGTYSATMYVDTSGHVMSVGITPPDEAGEGAIDCLVEVVQGISFSSPGSWPAKVTFDL